MTMDKKTAIEIASKQRQLAKIFTEEEQGIITAHFSVADRDVLQGIHGIPMREEPLPLLEAAIQMLIINTYAALNLSMTDDRRDVERFITDSIVNNAEIQHLSVKDIQNLLNDGVCGKYDTERIISLNVNIVNRWIISYMGKRIEINAQLKRLREQEERKKEKQKDPEQQALEFYEYVCSYILAKKELPPAGWRYHLYRHLRKMEMDCPAKEKEMFADLCKERLEQERLKILASSGLEKAQQFDIKYKNKDEFAWYCRGQWAEKWAKDLLEKVKKS